MVWNKIILGLSVLAVMGGSGCAGVGSPPKAYDYFVEPSVSDSWSPKIGRWQRRARGETPRGAAVIASEARIAVLPVAPAPNADAASNDAVGLISEVAPVSKGSPERATGREAVEPAPAAARVPGRDLRQKYTDFRQERRRALARDLSVWIQGQALIHYKSDGTLDHWATLEETLRGNGDDCDGLELLVYDALLSLGFERDEVFRAVIYRPEDLQHHMVTLWFEDPLDPWVIDPTGAMTDRMQHMSELTGWVPLKVFGLYREFTVHSLTQKLARSGMASAFRR